MESPKVVACKEADTSTSGSSGVEEDEPISAFLVETILNIKPNTGMNEGKVGILAHLSLQFDQFYPFRAPRICFTNKKGLDDEQYDDIISQIN